MLNYFTHDTNDFVETTLAGKQQKICLTRDTNIWPSRTLAPLYRTAVKSYNATHGLPLYILFKCPNIFCIIFHTHNNKSCTISSSICIVLATLLFMIKQCYSWNSLFVYVILWNHIEYAHTCKVKNICVTLILETLKSKHLFGIDIFSIYIICNKVTWFTHKSL